MARIQGTSLRDRLTGTTQADTILGGGGNDTIDGGAGNDTIKGGAGNDKLRGGTGNDKLYGEGGNDTFFHGTGADRIDGGAGIDTVTYVAAASATNVALDGSVSTGAAAGDRLFGIENVVGSRFADEIRGSNAANVLTGGTGNDVLFGFAGVDRLYGGDGNDIIEAGDFTGSSVADYVYGGDGRDSVSYIYSGTGVTVNLETGATGGGAANDRLYSIENVAGSFFADTLTVDAGGQAQGGDGDDVLSGSTVLLGVFGIPSTEMLFGNAGADTFVLHLNRGADIIADFSFLENDKFRVSDTGFGTAGTANIVNLTGTVSATVAAPQFIFDMLGSTLYFDGDGTGGLVAPVQVAFLAGFTSALSNVDFVFVA